MIVFLLALGPAQSPACDDPAGTTQINECAERRFATADAALNVQWTRTISTVKTRHPNMLTLLLSAQRNWLRYRDAHCQTEARLLERSEHQQLGAANCKTDLTRVRTSQLESIAEGD